MVLDGCFHGCTWNGNGVGHGVGPGVGRILHGFVLENQTEFFILRELVSVFAQSPIVQLHHFSQVPAEATGCIFSYLYA